MDIGLSIQDYIFTYYYGFCISIMANAKSLLHQMFSSAIFIFQRKPKYQSLYYWRHSFLDHIFLITESIFCVKILYTSKASIHSFCCYKAIVCQPEFLDAISFLIWNWSCKDAFHSAFDVLCPKSLTVSGFWQAVVRKFLYKKIYLVFQYYDDDVSMWRVQSKRCHLNEGLAYNVENWCK